MKKDRFVNLHCHTEYSIQDSVITIPKLYNQIKAYGQKATAVTDHGSCAAWVEFSDYFNKKGNIKPIFGNECYCTSEKIFDGDKRRQDHLVLLAMNNEGLTNIRRIQRLAVENTYYKPLCYYDKILEQVPLNGIFATSACSLSSISKAILDNNMDEAQKYAEYFYALFDGNFALELQIHPDYQDQYKINQGIVELSDKLDYPIIVTCDAHFCNETDIGLRKIIKAIGWKKMIDDQSLFDSLRSNCVGNSDLIKQWAIESHFEHMDLLNIAINNTGIIADMCKARLEEPQRRIPVFDKHEEFVELFNSVGDW